MLQTFTATDWLENCCISKETSTYICRKLKPFIEQEDTKLCKAICVEYRVAITLCSLATCGDKFCCRPHIKENLVDEKCGQIYIVALHAAACWLDPTLKAFCSSKISLIGQLY